MSNAPFWMKYVGLPYKCNADPESGVAADCIRMVLRVLEGAGFTPPPVDMKWYSHLARHEVNEVMKDWFSFTEQTYGPEQWAMTLLPGTDFGIAIVVNDGLLAVTPSAGVMWIPISSLPPLNYRRLKHA